MVIRLNVFKLIALFLLAPLNSSYGQAGKNDILFNPNDQGFRRRSGPDAAVHAIQHQPDGKIIIGGRFRNYCGVKRTMIARVNNDGSLDETFNQDDDLGNYLSSWSGESLDVFAIALQPDGKILVAGNFNLIKGDKTRSDLMRLNADGTLDETFSYFANTGTKTFVRNVLIQDGTSIVISGRPYFSRLTPDGNKDLTFNIGSGVEYKYTPYPPFYSTPPYPYTLPEIFTMAQQDDGKILISGRFNFFNGEAVGPNSPPNYGPAFIRVNKDGSLDNTSFHPTLFATDIVRFADGKFLINAKNKMNDDGTVDTSFSPAVTGGTAVIQSDQKIIVRTTDIVRLESDGAIDNTFKFEKQPSISSNWSKYLFIYDNDIVPHGLETAICLQPDGKLLIGSSTPILGNTSYLSRLNIDGTTDDTFLNDTNGVSGEVYIVRQQPDKKILIGGSFLSYNGVKRNSIARINEDGTLDHSFNPGSGALQYDQNQNKFAGDIFDIQVQPDGKVLIAGNFTTFNGTERKGIARLNADGTLDNFNPEFRPRKIGYFDNGTRFILIQPDGKIIFSYSEKYGSGNCKIQRLNQDGSLDTSFETIYLDPADHVTAAALLPDGKILIHGYINAVNNIVNKASCIRLHGNGQLDTSFNSQYVGNGGSMIVQPDGKILIASPHLISRFNPDGTPDYDFVVQKLSESDPSVIGNISLALLNDGRIIVGGNFPKTLLRLSSNGMPTGTFDVGEGAGTGFISAICPDENNRLIIGGSFISFDGVGRSSLTRLDLGKPTQSITFNPIPDKTFGDSPFTVSATSSTGQLVTFEASSNKISIANGNTINLVASGRGVITAQVPGNETYDASSNSISFCVNPKPPILNVEPSTTGTSPTMLMVQPPREDEYAWYKDGVRLLDVRGNYYSFFWMDIDLSESASYSVTATKEGCVSQPSVFVITEIEDSLHNSIELPFLFPNPSTNQIFIQFDFDAQPSMHYDIKILTAPGKHIKSICGARTSNEISVDISELPEGLYIVSIYDGRKTSTRKFIKK